MRRIPSWALALGALYALVHPLLAPRPDLDEVVPGEAVVTARYRGRAGLDALWCFGRDGDVRPSEDLAERHNLPGLAGVDPSGPFHWVLLPRQGRADPTLWIVPVADADRLRARFERRDGALDASHAYRRHAKHLEVRGRFAALAWDREAARRLGEGGLTLRDRGEDFGLAVDVPGAIHLALSQPGTEPWRSILEALGAQPGQAAPTTDPATGLRALAFPFGRVEKVAAAWRTARLWAWAQQKRIEIELEPASPALRERLAKVPVATAPGGEPLVPAGTGASAAEASLWIAGREAFLALALVLSAAGVDLPDDLPAPSADAPLTVRALPNQGERDAWTLEIQSASGAYDLALGALLGRLPEPGASLDLPPGSAPVTVASTRRATPSPAGHLSRSAQGSRLLLGADAQRLAQGDDGAAPAPPASRPADAPQRVIARGWISAGRALDLLGPALQPGGLFAALGLGSLHVQVATDGSRLLLTLERAP